MFNWALFNSHKTAKFQNTLAAAAVHRAITDEVLEKILLQGASYVRSAL
jgi:prophage antirepressor-like protein